MYMCGGMRSPLGDLRWKTSASRDGYEVGDHRMCQEEPLSVQEIESAFRPSWLYSCTSYSRNRRSMKK